MLKNLIQSPQINNILTQPGHSYIFTGPPGSGKTELAYDIAKQLIGRDVAHAQSAIIEISSELEGHMIKIDQIRDLLADLHLKQLETQQHRVVIIHRAHEMTEQSVNALLKTLEEPPELTTFLLLTSRLASIPPTIRSRSQIVRFKKEKGFVSNEAMRTLANEYLKASLASQFRIAKQVHDQKQAKQFLNALYESVAINTQSYSLAKNLLSAEIALAHNVNGRMVFEWLAMEQAV